MNQVAPGINPELHLKDDFTTRKTLMQQKARPSAFL
jgi:hypothetical protein